MNSTALVGTWKLESWELVDANGTVDYPFGRKPIGYIMYGPEGYMLYPSPQRRHVAHSAQRYSRAPVPYLCVLALDMHFWTRYEQTWTFGKGGWVLKRAKEVISLHLQRGAN